MKSLKILLNALFFSIFLIFTQSIGAIGIDENKIKASKIEGVAWNFEFKNKEKKAFQLSLKNGDTIILDRYAIQPSKGSDEKDHFYLRLSDLELNKPVYLAIFYPDKKGTNQGFLIQGTGKTEFLTYEHGNLRTQTGTGVFNKETQSGLILNNNISDKNIEKLSYDKALSYFNAPVHLPREPRKQPEEKPQSKTPLTTEQKMQAWRKMDVDQLKKEYVNISKQIIDPNIDATTKEELIKDFAIIANIIKNKKKSTWEKMSLEQLQEEARKIKAKLNTLKGLSPADFSKLQGQQVELTSDLKIIKSMIEEKQTERSLKQPETKLTQPKPLLKEEKTQLKKPTPKKTPSELEKELEKRRGGIGGEHEKEQQIEIELPSEEEKSNIKEPVKEERTTMRPSIPSPKEFAERKDKLKPTQPQQTKNEALTTKEKREVLEKMDLSQLYKERQNVERTLAQLPFIVNKKDRAAKEEQLNNDLKTIAEIIKAKGGVIEEEKEEDVEESNEWD